MNTRSILIVPLAGVLLVAVPALAQEPVPPPPPPAAPAPSICPASDEPCLLSHVVLGFELGVGAFEEGQPFAFGEGAGSGTAPGASWGVRIGWEFTRWLAIDAHYLGLENSINAQYSGWGSGRLITNAAMLELRLTLPTPYVQPYVFGGAGLYSMVVSGNGTAFNNSFQPGFPAGVGVAVPILYNLSVGAEATYHFQLGESFSSTDAISGGDLTTFNAMLRWRL